jgi:hypothetical protein
LLGVLYGYEAWYLTLIEEHGLKVFENGVLRRLFEPRRDEVTEDLGKLHNEKLHNFYSSQSIVTLIKSRRMRWTGHVPRMGAKKNAYRALVENPGRKGPLGRLRCRWVDNIQMDLKRIAGMAWTGVIWLRMETCWFSATSVLSHLLYSH